MPSGVRALILFAMTGGFLWWYRRTADGRGAELDGIRCNHPARAALIGFPTFFAMGTAANGIAALGMIEEARYSSVPPDTIDRRLVWNQVLALVGMGTLMYLTGRPLKSISLRPNDPPYIASLRVQAAFYSRLVRQHWLAVLGLAGAYDFLVRYEVTLPLEITAPSAVMVTLACVSIKTDLFFHDQRHTARHTLQEASLDSTTERHDAGDENEATLTTQSSAGRSSRPRCRRASR